MSSFLNMVSSFQGKENEEELNVTLSEQVVINNLVYVTELILSERNEILTKDIFQEMEQLLTDKEKDKVSSYSIFEMLLVYVDRSLPLLSLQSEHSLIDKVIQPIRKSEFVEQSSNYLYLEKSLTKWFFKQGRKMKNENKNFDEEEEETFKRIYLHCFEALGNALFRIGFGIDQERETEKRYVTISNEILIEASALLSFFLISNTSYFIEKIERGLESYSNEEVESMLKAVYYLKKYFCPDEQVEEVLSSIILPFRKYYGSFRSPSNDILKKFLLNSSKKSEIECFSKPYLKLCRENWKKGGNSSSPFEILAVYRDIVDALAASPLDNDRLIQIHIILGGFFNLSNNNLRDEGVKKLASILPSIPYLTHLNLFYNEITDKGMKDLSLGLLKLPYLTHLNLCFNSIGNEGVKELSKNLQNFSLLTHFDISHTSTGEDGLKTLQITLPHLESLTYLNFSENSLEKEGIQALTNLLDELPHLERLYLRSILFNKERTSILSSVLPSLRYLTHLDLSWNEIDNESGGVLFNSLGGSSLENIRCLDLSHNSLGLLCSEEMSMFFSGLKFLTHLKLDYNAIEGKCMKKLAKSLSPTLLLLDLSWNPLEDEGVKVLSSSLEHIVHLRQLRLNNVSLRKKGLDHLSRYLEHLKCLSHLEMSGNALEDVDFQFFLASAQPLQDLSQVDLRGNLLSDDAKNMLDSFNSKNSNIILYDS